jgi:hypothetical protein
MDIINYLNANPTGSSPPRPHFVMNSYLFRIWNWRLSSSDMTLQDATNDMRPDDIEMVSVVRDDERIREEEMPQLTSVVPQLRFWWTFSKWPLVFLVTNAIVITTVLLDLWDEERMMRWERPNHGQLDPNVIRNAGLWTVLLLVDALAFYKAAKVVEKQLNAMESESEVASPSSLSHRYVYARVSKMADNFLSGGRSLPEISLFLNLLQLAFTLALSSSLASAVTFVYFRFGPELERCLIVDDFTVPGVPVELQKWVTSNENEKGVDYVQLADKTIFFTTLASSDPYSGSRSSHLVRVWPNTTLEIFPEENIYSGFLAIGEDGFCFSLKDSDFGVRSEFDKIKPLWLLCYDSSDKSFRNTTIDLGEYSRSGHFGPFVGLKMMDMRWYNDTIWLRVNLENDWRRVNVRPAIYTVDHETMNCTEIAKAVKHARSNACAKNLRWLNAGVGAISLTFASFWLLNLRGCPAGMVPLISCIMVVFARISWYLAFFSALMGATVAAVSLVGSCLPPTMSRDMVLWALYTILLCLVSPFDYVVSGLLFPFEYSDNESELGFTVVVLLLLVVIGLILNHPVLQLMGWGVSIVTVEVVFMAFVTPYRYSGDWIFVLIGILVSVGLVTAGHCMTRYRAYMVWYSRRLWRALNEASPGRDNENLTQHLVTSRAD